MLEIPGNLLKLEGRGSVTTTWNDDSDVTIFIDDTLFSQTTANAIEKQGIRIVYRKVSDKTKTNSEMRMTKPLPPWSRNREENANH